MRVVLDTNVWVSGLLWRGAPWQIVQLVEDGHIEVYLSAAIVTELRRVLNYKRLQHRLKEKKQKKQKKTTFFLSVIGEKTKKHLFVMQHQEKSLVYYSKCLRVSCKDQSSWKKFQLSLNEMTKTLDGLLTLELSLEGTDQDELQSHPVLRY